MKILKFNKYSSINENKLIKETSEFLQFQFGIEPMGTQGGGGAYAFAQDPSSSYYNYQDSPYTDFYARQSGLVSNLNRIIQNVKGKSNLIYKDVNYFIQDIDNYTNFKILRIFENNNLSVDVYISFDYNNNEYFGVFKKFNGLNKPKLETELYFDPYYQYIFDIEYKLKLSNYFYTKLKKWFIPKPGFYKNLKSENKVKDNLGKMYNLSDNQTIEVLGYNFNTNNQPYVILKIKDKTYYIEGNDYFYFKWRFEKLN